MARVRFGRSALVLTGANLTNKFASNSISSVTETVQKCKNYADCGIPPFSPLTRVINRCPKDRKHKHRSTNYQTTYPLYSAPVSVPLYHHSCLSTVRTILAEEAGSECHLQEDFSAPDPIGKQRKGPVQVHVARNHE